MKIRLLLCTAAFALAFGPALRVQAADEPETELGAKMDKMSGPFRALRRQIADASKNADSLAKLKTIQENAQASLQFEPAKKADIPAADQQKFVADYQAKMKEMIAMLDKVEAALKANNNAEAEKLVGSLGDHQKASHKEFQKKKKKS